MVFSLVLHLPLGFLCLRRAPMGLISRLEFWGCGRRGATFSNVLVDCCGLEELRWLFDISHHITSKKNPQERGKSKEDYLEEIKKLLVHKMLYILLNSYHRNISLVASYNGPT